MYIIFIHNIIFILFYFRGGSKSHTCKLQVVAFTFRANPKLLWTKKIKKSGRVATKFQAS